MNKKICVIVIILIGIILGLWIKTYFTKNSEPTITTSIESTTNIYDLMINTVSRNIVGMDPTEMSSDEKEFYYNYLYDNSEMPEAYYR